MGIQPSDCLIYSTPKVHFPVLQRRLLSGLCMVTFYFCAKDHPTLSFLLNTEVGFLSANSRKESKLEIKLGIREKTCNTCRALTSRPSSVMSIEYLKCDQFNSEKSSFFNVIYLCVCEVRQSKLASILFPQPPKFSEYRWEPLYLRKELNFHFH